MESPEVKKSHQIRSSIDTTNLPDSRYLSSYKLEKSMSYEGPVSVRGKLVAFSLKRDSLYCFPVLSEAPSPQSFVPSHDFLRSEDMEMELHMGKLSQTSPFASNSAIHLILTPSDSLSVINSRQDLSDSLDSGTTGYIETHEEALITQRENDVSVVELVAEDTSNSSILSLEEEGSATKHLQSVTRFFRPRSLEDCNNSNAEEPNSLNMKIVLCKFKNSQLWITQSWIVTGFAAPSALEYSDTAKSKGVLPFPNLVTRFYNEEVLKFTSKNQIALMTCGYEHCALLTVEGKVLTWGFGASGALGQETFHTVKTPEYLQPLLSETVIYLEAGGYHTCAISETFGLYTWGRNDFFQLGVSNELLFEDTVGTVALSPIKIEFFDAAPVKSVACGEAHTLVLSQSGLVYAFGWAAEGQLGLPSHMIEKSIHSFEISPIQKLNHLIVKKISAGAFFSACITESGEVWTWGKGDEGQLGQGGQVLQSEFPQLVHTLENIRHITCGANYTVCLDKNGKSWGWGKGVAGVFSQDIEIGSEICAYSPVELGAVDIAYKIIF